MEWMRGINTQKKNLFIGVAVVPLVLISLVLLIIFRQIPGEINDIKLDFTNVSGNEAISKKTIQSIILQVNGALKQKAAQNFELSDKTISFNPATNPDIIPLNKEVLAVASTYFNSKYIKTVNKDFLDPLMLLAISNVETQDYNNTKILYAPAVPSALIAVTVDTIKEFGVDKATNLRKLFENPHYIGPLQEEVSFGVEEAAVPKDLKTNELGLVIKALGGPITGGSDTMSVYWSDVMKYQSNGRLTGDRMNWPDACNRMSGKMNRNFASYKGKELPNKYAFLALMGIASNTGESMIVNADGGNGSTFNSAGDARAYCINLGSDEIVKDIFDRAKIAISNHWTLKTDLVFRLNNDQAETWIKNWRQEGKIKRDYWQTINYEKTTFPVQVLYAYAQLYYLYHGE